MKRALFGSLIITLILSLMMVSAATAATVSVYLDEAVFAALPGVEAIGIPAADSLPLRPFAATFTGYSCQNKDIGISLAGGAITVKAPSASGYICIIGSAWNAGTANTNPTPTGPTIIANAEDDYQVTISFATPVESVGFKLLTNSTANETITLSFSDGTTQSFSDSQLDTLANRFEFVGFRSSHAITQVSINTTGGASQNEGIAGIWVVKNLPPTVNAGGPYNGVVGDPISIGGSASDPNGNSLTFTWTSNNANCKITNPNSLSPTVTCYQLGTFELTLSVFDGTQTVTSKAGIKVADPFFTKDLASCKPGTYDRYTLIETKFVSSVGLNANTPVVSSTVLDPAAKYLIEASGVYYAGGTGVYDIAADAKYTQDTIQRMSNVGWTDQLRGYDSYGAALLDLKVDGTPGVWGDFSSSHIYTMEKTGTGSPVQFQFQINEVYGQNNAGGLCVSIFKFQNDSPVANPGGPYLGAVNTEIAFSGTAEDPDDDTLSYLWSFGDDTIGTTASPTHAYTEPNVYNVCLTVNDGYVDSIPACTLAVVYDPSAGFVTGGGWINSPAGAYIADPALFGKATFGFISKYQKGANVPTGNTEFQFQMAGLRFKSTSYEWLVVAGDKAQFKGIGTVNGEGEYGFMLTAKDGTPDLFRIKIWDRATEEGIYDNQSGAEQTEEPTTVLGGGSIVIHK